MILIEISGGEEKGRETKSGEAEGKDEKRKSRQRGRGWKKERDGWRKGKR
jgi:hypothetical protein